MDRDSITTTTQWLMIADSHLICADGETDFFRLLEDISALPQNVGVIFLGDIFDLWIALPGYEAEAHQNFLAWSRAEKQRRAIVFIEGNHEFFVKQRYHDAFSDCEKINFLHGDCMYTHGDRLNRKDWTYSILRFLLRNSLTRLFLWLVGRTIGPAISHYVRERLRTVNLKNKVSFPEAQLRRAGRDLKPGITTVFMGHFHDQYSLQEDGHLLEIIPAYKNNRELGLYDIQSRRLTIAPIERLHFNSAN